MTDTARDFITLAFKEAGVLGVGQTLLAEDINDGLTYLRRMMSQWQKRRWLVPYLYDIAMPGNGLKSNKIGPGQYWNAPRPDKIQSAYIIQNISGTTTPVSLPCRLIFSYEDYALIAVKDLNSLPYAVFYDGAYPYGNVFFFPIPSSSYECHLIVKGSANWQQQISDGFIEDAGSGYVDGVYPAIPLIGGGENQQAATGNFTVAGGVVTAFEIQSPGQNYVINDVLGVDNADLGGTGSGFVYRVTNTTISLDSQFDMPEEYEEAIHYNLAIRLCSGYLIAAGDDTRRLAKASLNTIRAANTQVPTLGMPRGLRRTNGFSLWNPDGYGAS
ncbi:MAG: hypothetical protein V4440_13695 [Pseudomonadota bacterium]